MADVIMTMVNEASNAQEFQDAAIAVRNHIRTGRNPDLNQALMAGLAVNGLALIAEGVTGTDAWQIAREAMLTLNTDPG